MATLTRSLAPLPEESLPGYLLRLAHRLGRSPARIGELTALAPHTPGRVTRLPAHLLVALRPSVATAFAGATRLTPGEVAALGLRQYADGYPPLAEAGLQEDGRHLQNRWAFTAASRFCPTCLKGDDSPVQRAHGGAWRQRWHLPVVFACTRHRQLLEHLCPHCRRPVNESFRGRAGLLLHIPNGGLHPLQCRNLALGTPAQRRLRSLCGAHLTRADDISDAPSPSEDPTAYLALQERIQHRLTDAEDPFYFHDLITVAQLIKISWPASTELVPLSAPMGDVLDTHIESIRGKATKLPGRHHGREMLGPPPQAAACASLLFQADQLLADRDPVHLRENMQILAENAFERERLRFAGLIRRRPMTQPLARALGRQYRGFHAGLRRELAATRLRVPSRESRFTAAHVPQLIPLDWYDRHLQQFTSQLTVPSRLNAKHVRRAAALKLVEMTSGGTLTECAKLLDMPLGHATSAVGTLRDRCPADQAWEIFQSAMEAIATDLEQDPALPNLAHRRRALARWTIPADDWSELTRGLHRKLAQPRHHQVCSVIAWTRATKGDHLFSPLVRADGHGERLPDGKKLVTDVNQLLNIHRGGLQTLRERLEHYAEQLATRCDTADLDED